MKDSNILVDDSILFLNKSGVVCEIKECGDSSFLVARSDISYSVETVHD